MVLEQSGKGEEREVFQWRWEGLEGEWKWRWERLEGEGQW